jgi:phosphate-selective porin OprO/OprP
MAPDATLAPAPGREKELEQRVQELEALVRRLGSQVETLSSQPQPPPPADAPSPSLPEPAAILDGTPPTPAPAVMSFGGSPMSPAMRTPELSSNEARAPGRFNMPAVPEMGAAQARYGNGFEIRSPDDEYSIQFHNLTQIDYRGYEDTPKNDVLIDRYQSTFGFPRVWWIFNGRVGKPFEYFVVPAFSFDNVNLLDAFFNINFDPRLQLKFGRYKTPFTYEFYGQPINALVNPERSLFFNNFGLNRDVGFMAWGQLFDKRLDYGIGVFNGDRNFFVDRNSSKDTAGFLNFRPFLKAKDSPLENLNFGGSLMGGNEFNQAIPRILRTNVATTGSSFYGVPFLAFRETVIESGNRFFLDLHAAWYYKRLSLIGEWATGFQDYAFRASPGRRTSLPVSGYYAQAGYFLTGETVSGRGVVKPRRNFDLRAGKEGPGAFELAARFNALHVGEEAFTANLADPRLWSNNAQLIDVGVNWYWNPYVKLYFGWQHATFGKPVFVDPGDFQLTNDMGWARAQVSF